MIRNKKSLSSSNSKVANAVGGRTARACDSCLRRRARWFCAADDAFLCQSCDSSVHSANQLASRHERVRLQTSSLKPSDDEDVHVSSSPAWHRGFTRKPRTPRRQHNHHKSSLKQPKHNDDNVDFVPEMSNEESPVTDEEQLLYRVPVFDQPGGRFGQQYSDHDEDHDLLDHQIQGFLDSEIELAEFAADVESLLGVAGIEEDYQPCQFDDLFPRKEDELEDFDIDIDNIDVDLEPIRSIVKVEEDDHPILGFQPNHNSSASADDDGKLLSPATVEKMEIILNLNYEAVIAAWDSQGSPWMTGIRPNVKPEHGWQWPDFMVTGPTDFSQTNGELGLGHVGSSSGHSNEGREARVSRYREKRRTRLFSKKIRYEVRKLNAEKRPRMKGRFVKRTSFNMGANNINGPSTMIGSTTFPYFTVNK